MRAGDKFSCDKCGADVGNGGVDQAWVATGLTSDNRMQIVYWCLDKCAPKVLSKANLRAFLDDAKVDKLELYEPPSDD